MSKLDELQKLGERISNKLKGYELIGLSGELGAGKTTLTKYIAKGLGIKEEIISPTYNILKVYESGKFNLFHIDAYRLENLGYDPILDDYLFDNNAIKIIEWYNYLYEGFQKIDIKIDIKVLEDLRREINIEGLCLD